MTRSHITLKAAIAVCMAALVALAIAGCASSSQSQGSSSTASSATSSATSETASSSAESTSSGDSSDALESDSAKTVAGKSSGSISGSSSASSASAPTSSSTSIATGQLVDVKNTTLGYTFKTDKGYDVKFDDADTAVYTSAKSGAVPYFELTVMKNPTGRSVEDFLTEYGNAELQKYKDRMVVEPMANTVKLPDRSIKGIEYIRTNDAGDKKIAVMTYVEQNNSGTFFTWRTICYSDDAETPAAMEEAMKTFKFLAS